MRSVRARAALGATLVVAVAVVAVVVVAAGFAVLLVMRSNLIDQTDLQAEVAAREVASQVALDVPYDKLDLPDRENRPVQIVDEGGRVLAVNGGLEAISSAGNGQVKPQAGSPDGTEEADDDPRRGEVSVDGPRFSSGSATVDGEPAAYRFAAVKATTGADRTVTVYAGAPQPYELPRVGGRSPAQRPRSLRSSARAA